MDYKLILPSDLFGLILPFNQYAKKNVTLLTGLIGPNDREIELMFNICSRKAQPSLIVSEDFLKTLTFQGVIKIFCNKLIRQDY